MAELLTRLVVWLTFTIVAGVVRLLLLAIRLVLWGFALVGFRGARLAALAATLVGVRWAAPIVGAGPAVRLAAIGWAAWALRHHRAAIRQHAAVRRLTAVMEGYATELAAATRRLQPPAMPKPRPGPGPALAPRPGRVPGLRPPWPAAELPADRGVAALGRYAEAWARRHAAPTPKEPR